METHDLRRPDALLRRLTLPVTAAVAGVVGTAWYVTWAASGTMMMLIVPAIGSSDLVLFSALLVVMMVAMDTVGTLLFLIPYVIVWGGFGVVALLALAALGLMGSMLAGPLLYVPAAILVAAGMWQVTRTKEVCLAHCTSPAGFVLHHWHSGRLGALRMGFRHSLYCIGCCWLFMLVLFISGSMSLVWMGGLSVAIFGEKLGVRTRLFSRAIGVLLVVLGSVVAASVRLAM